MIPCRIRFPLALALSLGLHGGLLAPWSIPAPPVVPKPLEIRIVSPEPVAEPTPPRPRRAAKQPRPVEAAPETPPQSLAAPSAPTAEEWALAATYAPRNGKRYRNAWGQQVRSMMGTAVAGPDQGMVRFRIEIAPDGKVARVEELWSTSEKASQLAWQAIRKLPPLPPTPNGKPLVFEQTISFLPYETGWPPSYKLDCLPEPAPFRNPFVWDGGAPPNVVPREHRPPPPEGCPPDSTADTIEEEEQSFKRQMDQWRWAR